MENEDLKPQSISEGIVYNDKIIPLQEINDILQKGIQKSIQKGNRKEKIGRNIYRIISYTFMAVALVLLIWIVLHLCDCNCNCNSNNGGNMQSSIVLDPSAHASTASDGAVEADNTEFIEQSIAVPGFGDQIFLQPDTDILYMRMSNPIRNIVFFQYSIILADTGEVIFQSDQIKPGFEITEEKLNRTFQRGVYPIIIKIDTMDIVTHSTTNGASFQSNLVVE
jgi:hypothetical protein